MRRLLVAAAVLVGSMSVTIDQGLVPMAGTAALASAIQQEPAPPAQPPAQPQAEPRQPAPDPAPASPQVNVEIRERGWYASPTWIAIGAIGLVVLILVVAMASRTSSNTVIRG
jgi:hypothetical protein